MKPSHLCLIATLLVTPFAVADEVAVPVGKQAQGNSSQDKSSQDKSSTAIPKTGMKADKVEEKFGAPQKKSDPVGKPPISIWDYPQYRVYFEGDRVIHTVLKAEPEATTEPVAAPATPVEATPVTPPAEVPATPVPAASSDASTTSPTDNKASTGN